MPRPTGKARPRLPVPLIAIAVTLVVGLGTLMATGVIRLWGQGSRADIITHTVGYERLQLTITERGTLESAENSDVVCRVKARSGSSTIATTIRWVVEDGTQVKKGDRLVQLDDSGLIETLKTQKITVDKARADWIQADKLYEITESQNKSDIAKEKLNLELMRIDLEKYQKGLYLQTKAEIEGRIKIAESDLGMWEERAAWSARMSKPGRRYVTTAQAQADEARLKSAQIALQKVQEEMRVLEKFTGPRDTKDAIGKVEEAVRAVERVEAQAKAKEVQFDADRRGKRSIYEQEMSRLYDIEEEIKKCQIYAPQDGLVVYYVPEQSRFGSGSQQSIVAQGEPVREGQKLMRIPNLEKMVVSTRVHEAMVSRVRGEKLKKTGFSEAHQLGLLFAADPFSKVASQLHWNGTREDYLEDKRDKEFEQIAKGQAATIRVEAFPDRALPGHVKTVATVASQQDWLSADVKVYQAMVSIDDSVDGLKPGMSAEVVISTDSKRDNVLTIPVQSILGSVDMGNKRRVYVQGPSGPEPREVEIGLSNDRMAEVVSGLAAGDKVIVNPRVVLTDREKAEFGDAGGYRPGGDQGPGKDKQKGKDKKGKKEK
ncbi:MAG: hypothetical protein K2W96_28660 [Gemmataceae bacterium]|nr:hypothetical protein [Gemmataceae bacterium]